jgi:phospholipase/lecithinase/hemolysin
VVDVTQPCLSFGVVVHAVCRQPRQHLFWDGAHLTRAGHHLIAEAVLRLVDEEPEHHQHESSAWSRR